MRLKGKKESRVLWKTDDNQGIEIEETGKEIARVNV